MGLPCCAGVLGGALMSDVIQEGITIGCIKKPIRTCSAQAALNSLVLLMPYVYINVHNLGQILLL